MSWIHAAIDLFFHLNKHLDGFAANHPVGVYGLLVAIIFCETGLVVWPFLPGDSLLFAVGALAASGNGLHLPLAIVLMCVAANCGDLLNYMIGYRVGPAVFSRPDSWLLSTKHLAEANAFYEKHGRKTIVLARFVPIVRTFAPFVAGIGRMPLSRFIGFSVFGGIAWVVLMSLAGYLFGHIAFVQSHFELVVLAIVVISLLPMAYHALASPKGAAAIAQ